MEDKDFIGLRMDLEEERLDTGLGTLFRWMLAQ